MSRLFNDATPHYLTGEPAPVTAPPFSVSMMMYCDDATISQAAFFLGDLDSTAEYHYLMARGDVGGDPIRIASRSVAEGSATADTSTGFTANTWTQIGGVWASTASRSAYIAGGSKGTNTTTINTAVGNSRIALGMLRDSTPSDAFSGRLAECGLWDVALTDAEMAILGKGVSPLLVRPASLMRYWQLVGTSSPEFDRMGAQTLTVTGATKAEHAPMKWPGGMELGLQAAAPPAGAVPHNVFGKMLSGPFGGAI